MDKQSEQFQADLLQSVKEMKAGRQGRIHHVPTSLTLHISTDSEAANPDENGFEAAPPAPDV